MNHIRRRFASRVTAVFPPLVVPFELSQRRKAIVADVLAGAGEERGFACAKIACFRTPPSRLYEG
jgi:hypothetical protein